MTVHRIGQEAYAQLREAAKTSVNAAISRYNAFYPWLDSEEKEDIVSEAVTKGLRTFREGEGSTFQGWVKRIAYQITIDRMGSRRETSRIYLTDEDGYEVEIPQAADLTTPEDVVEGWEKEEMVNGCIRSRSEFDVLVFDLHTQGYQPREIAERFGTTSNNVSVHLDRMKKAVTRAVAA